MKLYLSSYRLGNNPKQLFSLLSENKKAAVVVNAVDFEEDTIRGEKLHQEFLDLESVGIYAEEIDLRNFFGKKENLEKKIADYGMIWVRGGNSFILRKAFAYSGLDEIIKAKVSDQNFVYAGYSAGICILPPTLKGVDLVDDPAITPKGYKSEIIWEGLNIVPFSIVPHYKSDHPEAGLVDREVAYLTQNNIAFRTLRDGEVIIDDVFLL